MWGPGRIVFFKIFYRFNNSSSALRERRIDEQAIDRCRLPALGNPSLCRLLLTGNASGLCESWRERLHAKWRALDGFALAPLLSGTMERDPSTVQVTPGGGHPPATLLLTLNTTASAGKISESFFHFIAMGDLRSASIGLGNPLPPGTEPSRVVSTYAPPICLSTCFWASNRSDASALREQRSRLPPRLTPR